jgi:hypothetical protein
LSKYRKPAADAERERKDEEVARLRRIKKEKQRLQGRVLPRKDDEDHERTLVRMATKGVVQLFNTVSEFQSSEKKEVHKEVVAQKTKYSRILESTGDAYANTSNKKIIENSLLVASTSFKSNGTCEDSLWATLRRIRSSFYAGVWSFSVIGNEFELLFISKRISPCCQFARV